MRPITRHLYLGPLLISVSHVLKKLKIGLVSTGALKSPLIFILAVKTQLKIHV